MFHLVWATTIIVIVCRSFWLAFIACKNYKRKSLNIHNTTTTKHRQWNRPKDAFQNQFNAFYHFIHRKRKSVYEWEGEKDLWLLFSFPQANQMRTRILNGYLLQKKNHQLNDFIDNGSWVKTTECFSFIRISWFKTNRLNQTIFIFQLAIYRLCARDDVARCDFAKFSNNRIKLWSTLIQLRIFISIRRLFRYAKYITIFWTHIIVVCFFFLPLLDTHLYKWHGRFTYACVCKCLYSTANLHILLKGALWFHYSFFYSTPYMGRSFAFLVHVLNVPYFAKFQWKNRNKPNHCTSLNRNK